MSHSPQRLPAPQLRSSRSGTGILVFSISVFVLVFLLLGAWLVISLFEDEDGLGLFRKKIAVVEIFGAIYDAEKWVDALEDCADRSSIAGVVMHIDSPGGAIAPTQEIFDAARKVADKGKPVIAYLGSVAASGGYYAACAADEIYCMSGTLTGSIGVYIQAINLSDLLKRWGVEFNTIKKGAFKTAGDYSRDMKGYERAMFQSVVDDYYQQFVEAVVQSRDRNRVSLSRGWNEPLPGGAIPEVSGTASLDGMLYPSPAWGSVSPGLGGSLVVAATGASSVASATRAIAAPEAVSATTAAEEKKSSSQDKEILSKLFAEGLKHEEIRKRVETLAEGRIYTGRQGLAVGLVDRIGTLQDAIDRAGVQAGLGKDPKTTTKKMESEGGLFGLKVNLEMFTGSRFLYLCPFGI